MNINEYGSPCINHKAYYAALSSLYYNYYCNQVESVRRRKEQLLRQRQELETERRRWSTKLERIEQFVLGGLGKNVVEYTLQVPVYLYTKVLSTS